MKRCDKEQNKKWKYPKQNENKIWINRKEIKPVNAKTTLYNAYKNPSKDTNPAFSYCFVAAGKITKGFLIPADKALN